MEKGKKCTKSDRGAWHNEPLPSKGALLKIPLFLLFLSSLLFFGCTIPDLTEKGNVAPGKQAGQPQIPPKAPSLPPLPQSEPVKLPTIAFLDVGNGEATLFLSQGKAILVDAGPDPDAKALRAALAKYGVKELELVAITRPTDKHYAGLSKLTPGFGIKRVITNGATDGQEYKKLLAQLSKNKVALEDVSYGWSEKIAGFDILVLNPPKGEALGASDAKDSLVLLVKKGPICALLMSDAQASGAIGSEGGTVFGGVEARLAADQKTKGCQILRVGDSGSGNTASFQLLESTRPKYAVISVGNNGQGLPAPVTLERLALRNVSVYRTDTGGDILVFEQNQTYSVAKSKAS